MNPDRDEAAGQIADIEAISRAVRQSVYYRLAGEIMLIWGVLVAIGDLLAQLLPRYGGGATWVLLNAIGFAITLVLGGRARRRGYALDWRAPTAMLLFFGFGLLWSVGVGKFGPRELSVFWPTLFQFGYAVAGLWLGRAFVVLGVGVALLVTAGYFWAGPLFYLYLAIVNGGGLILCALWMRRA